MTPDTQTSPDDTTAEPKGQYRLDVGRAAGCQHGRLAAPAHRHHPRPGHPGRTRRPRRQGHDRHPAVAAHRRPGPADPPRPPPGAAAAARAQPAPGDPRPAEGTARSRLTRAPRAPAPSSSPTAHRPGPRKGKKREPGAGSRAISMPSTGKPGTPRSFTEAAVNSPRYSRNRVRYTSGRSGIRGLGPVSSAIWSTVTLPAEPRHADMRQTHVPVHFHHGQYLAGQAR